MFLLNHYESNRKHNANHNYDSIDFKEFDSLIEEIKQTREEIKMN